MAGIAFPQLVGQQRLVAKPRIVDKRDAGYPIAVRDFAVPLNVVLASCEIPQEIAPIHVVELVLEEISKVFRESGHFDGLCRVVAIVDDCLHRFCFDAAHARFVFCFRAAIVKAWEEHVGGRGIAIVAIVFVVDFDIAVGRAGCRFDFFFVFCRFFGNRIAGCIAQHGGRIDRSIEEGSLAILLAVEVAAKGKYVVGRVLVHRRLCRGADQDERIRRIAGKNDGNVEHYVVKNPHGKPLPAESKQVDCQGGRQQYRNEQRISDEENAGKESHQQEDPFHGVFVALLVEYVNAPNEQSGECKRIGKRSGIEAEPECVDKQQFGVLCHFHETRNKPVKDEHDDCKRQQKSEKRTFDCGFFELAIVDHEDDCRNAQQVKQVYGNRYANHVGNGYQIAVGARIFASVFPFQDKPKRKCRAEGRKGINFAFDCRKPECVAPSVNKRAAKPAAHDDGEFRPRKEIQVVVGFDD